MHSTLIFLLLFLLPILGFTQTSPAADSANKLIQNGQDCDNRTFTRVERLPALKVSNREYADTLDTYLTTHNAFLWNRAFIKKAILQYSNLWLPARQNGYIVNAYVRLVLTFDEHAVGIEISQ